MPNKIGKALVVGAGISGIKTALDLAETGYGVTLIDRSPHIGGVLSQLDYQFPTNRCGMCKMLPLVDRDASSQYCLRKGLFHKNIEILLSTELLSVKGEPGNFQILLKQKPNRVDPVKCIGCGLCVDVCPVEVPDEFNEGLNNRKAIYLPVPHTVPNPYIIDASACTQCGECEKVCPTEAIRLLDQDRRKFKILVVDDELIVRDSLKEWLEEEGFSVDMSESGQEAIQKLGQETYHLMLTDIKMPGMDGVEVLQSAKELFPDLTVIMMTAYATVETAVEAMKIGALDYLIKPFEPDKMIPMILKIYEEQAAAMGTPREVGAVVLCGGTDYYDPSEGKNPYGYGIFPNVLTSIEFERVTSGLGPTQGQLCRPSDGKPIRKIGWIQCVGSRDLQTNADYCSNICCMYAIKEALIAKEKNPEEIEASIFYMDMRTFEKPFQRYRDKAETEHGVRFIRGRIHSISENHDKDLVIRYTDPDGTVHETIQNLMVLSVGQRPSAGVAELCEMIGIESNPWGFAATEPFSFTRTARNGIVVGGAYSGLKDISNSVIQASAAALTASRLIHASGGGLAPEPSEEKPLIDVSREQPRILVVICTCGKALKEGINLEEILHQLKADPYVNKVELLQQLCTQTGWNDLPELIKSQRPNRVLIGACRPYAYAHKLRELGKQVGLNPSLIDVVDIRTPIFGYPDADKKEIGSIVLSSLEMGVARVKYADPFPVASCNVNQRALVVGGGIAGMTAALAIADHGFHVDLIEKSGILGGNLHWMKQTIEGLSTASVLEKTLSKIEKHPLIETHMESSILSSFGSVGTFFTTIEDGKGAPHSITHGVTVLATGGREALTMEYGYGQNKAVVTQKELSTRLDEKRLDPSELGTVVMIQCVGSREEPRNYCSRVCCSASLKHALQLKAANPDIDIYILYRDMMAFGFIEAYYTEARKAGIIFIQYNPERKPEVDTTGESLRVKALDPVIGKILDIKTDLLVLATGVVPDLPADLAATFGTTIDQDGFFQEADFKWRPVDALKEGVFACGLALSPRSVPETIATAEAAAQRTLRILSRKSLPAGKVVANVRHSLCSLCERCIDACPYGARVLNADEGKIAVNPVMCQGCGSCATVCPNGASVLDSFPRQQLFATIDAAIKS